MTAYRSVLAAGLALYAAAAWGQQNARVPHIGYLYPAGGRQGTSFQVKVGGQWLQGVRDVYVSGAGVSASVTEYIRPLTRKEIRDTGRRIRGLARQRTAVKQGRGVAAAEAALAAVPALPDHPLLQGLDTKSPSELAKLRDELFNPKKQPNAQLAGTALIQVTIDRNAEPGDRELRLASGAALTNPMLFQVGLLPEAHEQEPNDPLPFANRPNGAVLDSPVVLNGQIEPGGVDRFRLRAYEGQRLVIETHARRLIPYLADAVPGWFQATLALYDSDGIELAFADDYRFDPDPVLLYEIPKAGEYELEIRDAIYRGREDFVYRIAVGVLPFTTQMFPLGGPVGVDTVASVDGWNIIRQWLPLHTKTLASIRQTALRQGSSVSNRLLYAVDDLPECADTEPNDTAAEAQQIALPRVVNGRIARPGDVDVFEFKGRAGEQVVAEVQARRLYSPLDSLLRLTDASGKVLEWNDDYMQKDGHLHTDLGELTHHADSYLTALLPAYGTYRVQLGDAQNHGGGAYAYRLRISPPQPDFALRVNPSSVNVPAGSGAAVWVHVLRKDGFDGDIEVALSNPPSGFALHGGRIPPGLDRVRMTLMAPRAWLKHPFVLRLEGRADIGGRLVTHLAVPSEDMMQAFLWRHLTPSQQLMVKVVGAGKSTPVIELAESGPVRVPAGGMTRVRVNVSGSPMLEDIKLELTDPPDGVTIQDVMVAPGGLAFALKTDADAPGVGYADNLIVEASVERVRRRADGTVVGPPRRVSLGVLPAIPFEVVQG